MELLDYNSIKENKNSFNLKSKSIVHLGMNSSQFLIVILSKTPSTLANPLL